MFLFPGPDSLAFLLRRRDATPYGHEPRLADVPFIGLLVGSPAGLSSLNGCSERGRGGLGRRARLTATL